MSETSSLAGEPQSSAAARRIIDDIRSQRGYVDESDEIELRKTSPAWQERYRRDAEEKRNMRARFTKTIADQLYSSKYRCIPEILQNADDARYSETSCPTLSFRIRPSEMIIDLNEDGFTRANVVAICSTGESSKVDDPNTTGKKGFGFKSIFGIARRVHIQSGFWSFRFEHRRNENGLGMVTPLWTEPAAEFLPDNVGTRFRLMYAEDTDRFLRTLVAEFEKLSNTTIFATRNIKRLEIAFEGVADRDYRLSFEKQGSFDQDEIRILTRVVGQSDQHQQGEMKIRVFKTTFSDLPLDDVRSSQPTDIVVGFQVDPESGDCYIPERGQQIFAFLPVKRLPQLPFLIQADFALVANREEVPECDRNNCLHDGIADTFTNAVTRICENDDDPLAYSWMRYLPEDSMGGFWETFPALIEECLSKKSVLLSMGGELRQPFRLRVLPPIFKHEDEPLFPDNIEGIYLATGYEENDIEILRNIGLEDLSDTEMVGRLEEDVLRNPETHLHGQYQDQSWHSSFAILAEHLMHDQTLWHRVSELSIIPLDNGDWISPQSLSTQPVYLPYLIDEGSVQIQIPNDLGLRKLHPLSCLESEASSFYAALGISSCSERIVIEQILEFHKQLRPEGTLDDAIAHLEILFWYWESHSTWPGCTFLSLPSVHAANRNCKWSPTTSLFFRSHEQYHADKLLEHSSLEELSRLGFGFLHDGYMRSSVQHSIRGDMTWKGFLELFGVRYYPQLVERRWSSATLNPVLSLIARDNPGQFVGNLEAHWSESYAREAESHKGIIKETKILCQNGRLVPLEETLLPTLELLRKSDELDIQSAMQFIKLRDGALETGEEQWKFLRELGVICDLDLKFYFEALQVLSQVDEAQISTEGSSDKFTRICASIYQGIAMVSKLEDEEELRRKFTDSPYVFVPDPICPWFTPEDCVWDGPSFLGNKSVLRNIYNDIPEIKRLFVVVLNVKDATLEHVIEDLIEVRRSDEWSDEESVLGEDVSLIAQYYETLSGMVTSGDLIQQIRSRFEEHDLIYASGCWCKPSKCIWNSTVELLGHTPLEQSYPTLQNFFVKQIGVKKMSANVLAHELIEASKSSTQDIKHIQSLITALGNTISTKPDDDQISERNLENLKNSAFLPVRTPQGVFSYHVNDDFWIQDHERYSNAFIDKVNLLDFSPAELTSLHSFFSLVGLESRYLSRNVDARTMVNSSMKNDDLTNHLRQRAYALSCCANSYRSPRYYNKNVEIHRLLCNAEVFLCDDIWTNLIVMEQGNEVEVRSDRAFVKVEQKEQSLAISVPSDEEGLYSCYRTELPSELAQILGIEKDRAEKTVYRILNDEEMELGDIMRDEDIPNYGWFERPPPSTIVRAPGLPARQGVDQGDDPQGVHDLPDSGVLQDGDNQEDNDPDIIVTTRLETSSQQGLPSLGHSTILSNQPRANGGSTLQNVLQERAYRRLLQSVIRQARRVPRSATETELSLLEIEEALDSLDPDSDQRQPHLGLSFGFFTSSEENFKIGAAGELFVFERLRALAFPGFDLDNWQSRIRALVNVHPDYAALRNWPAAEIADLMYKDNTGEFENWLRRCSRHSFPSLPQDGEIQYLIEVKTTTGPCSSPFFMSKNQYQLMRQHRLENEGGMERRVVYVIVRVYSLLGGNIAMELYVDPWRLRDEFLEFVADPWKVIPARL